MSRFTPSTTITTMARIASQGTEPESEPAGVVCPARAGAAESLAAASDGADEAAVSVGAGSPEAAPASVDPGDEAGAEGGGDG